MASRDRGLWGSSSDEHGIYAARVGFVGLGLALFYLVFVVAGPLVITRTHTGQSALRSTRGAARMISGLFVAANVLILLGPTVDVAGSVHRLEPFDRVLLQSIGLVVAALALPLIVQARRTMGASWRIGVDTNERTPLVTDGLFGRVRHPIYTAMVVLAVGVFFVVPNIVCLVAAVAFWIAVELQARTVEDPYLNKTHPDYAAYAAATGRFVPGVGRLHRA